MKGGSVSDKHITRCRNSFERKYTPLLRQFYGINSTDHTLVSGIKPSVISDPLHNLDNRNLI